MDGGLEEEEKITLMPKGGDLDSTTPKSTIGKNGKYKEFSFKLDWRNVVYKIVT
jgi:hypothetical protein